MKVAVQRYIFSPPTLIESLRGTDSLDRCYKAYHKLLQFLHIQNLQTRRTLLQAMTLSTMCHNVYDCIDLTGNLRFPVCWEVRVRIANFVLVTDYSVLRSVKQILLCVRLSGDYSVTITHDCQNVIFVIYLNIVTTSILFF